MAPKQDIFWLKENSLYNKGRTLEKKLVFSKEKNWVEGGTPLKPNQYQIEWNYF